MKLTCSNLSAQSATISPAAENAIDTSTPAASESSGWGTYGPTKSAAVSQVRPPTSSARVVAAARNAARISPYASGVTSRSTMVPCSFMMNKEDEVLRNALLMIPSMTRPGTRKRMYGTPSTSRSLPPSDQPKTTKYSAVVISGERMVCPGTRRNRFTSFRYNVRGPSAGSNGGCGGGDGRVGDMMQA